jgi:hypothetical protein
MNMLLHGVKDTEFDIFHGDTLLNEWDMMREQNLAKKPSFDAIVANPPLMNAPAFTLRAACRQSVSLRSAQLPLGTHRRPGRRRALQKPRPRPQVRR